jgi:hypothetical protein
MKHDNKAFSFKKKRITRYSDQKARSSWRFLSIIRPGVKHLENFIYMPEKNFTSTKGAVRLIIIFTINLTYHQ